ncbi:MAG TPA: 5-oxoprolinase subunit PxpA [Candidatus Eremiobacteraceae bacterium]|nr:5-oxoprolinase subunit PxpA [Candidatus Eremiobacteraceae bacterium]
MNAALRIDLNCDAGESLGDDDAMFDVVTSANIACGFHAGDESTMESTVRSAVRHGVAVGAHPSYPDVQGFGRRTMRVSPAEAEAFVFEQIEVLRTIAKANGSRVTHVKPHGALYNDAARDRSLADAIAAAVRRSGDLRLVGLAGSAFAEAARSADVAFIAEGFCDRAYGEDGHLVSRSVAGSLITDPQAAARQAVDIAVRGRVRSSSGNEIAVVAQTLCIHGDTPGAVDIARAVRAALEGAGVRVARFEAAP